VTSKLEQFNVKSIENKGNFDSISLKSLYQIFFIIAEYFKSSFGPKGLDKLIQDKFNDIMIISNDGGTILDNLIDLMNLNNYSIGKYAISWAKTIYAEESDYIKTFYILLAELLKYSLYLEEEGISRAIIINAIYLLKNLWNSFFNDSKFIFEYSSNSSQLKNNSIKNENNQKVLFNIIKSSMSGKFSSSNIEHISKVVLEVINKMGNYILNPRFRPETFFQIEFIPGTTIKETKIFNGILIKKDPVNLSIFPSEGIKNPRIILIRQKLYIDLPEEGEKFGPQGFAYEFRFSKIKDVENFNNFSKYKCYKIFQKIAKLKPDIVLTYQGVDRNLESLFVKNNIILVRRVKKKQFFYLSNLLGIKPVENINEINENFVGIAKFAQYKKFGRNLRLVIELNTNNNLKIGSEKYLFKNARQNYQRENAKSKNPFNSKTFLKESEIPSIGTILIGGSMWLVCEEIKRYFIKSIKIARDLFKIKKIFYGGGNTELRFVNYINKNLFSISKLNNGKLLYAIEKLSEAFYIIPKLLIENSGQNAQEIITEMIATYNKGNDKIGFHSSKKCIIDMQKEGLYENAVAKNKIFHFLFEALIQILSIDQIIKIRKKRFKQHKHANED